MLSKRTPPRHPKRFYQVRGYYNRKGKSKRYKADLPKHLHHRIDAMIARDLAVLLWTRNAKIATNPAVQAQLSNMYNLLADNTYKWKMHVGHVVPRDLQFTSLSDACLIGGCAFCHNLQYWFDIHWSTKTKQANTSNKIHIYIFEFVVVILQLAATITLVKEIPMYQPLRQLFPTGIEKLANLLIRTDNSPSQNWAHKVSAKPERGQQMVHVYAALLERTTLAVSCTHIPGAQNTLADYISRPPTHLPFLALRHQQIFEKAPRLASFRYFRPSPELLSHLTCRLFKEQWTATQTLTKQQGQFEAGDSITSSFVIP